MSTVLLNKEQPLKSRLIEELAVAPDGLAIWAEFCKAVPAPPDLRLVCLVTQGASAAFATACTFLSLPNAKAQGVAAQFQRIQVAAQQVPLPEDERGTAHQYICRYESASDRLNGVALAKFIHTAKGNWFNCLLGAIRRISSRDNAGWAFPRELETRYLQQLESIKRRQGDTKKTLISTSPPEMGRLDY